jgi:hypothetical protein
MGDEMWCCLSSKLRKLHGCVTTAAKKSLPITVMEAVTRTRRVNITYQIGTYTNTWTTCLRENIQC